MKRSIGKTVQLLRRNWAIVLIALFCLCMLAFIGVKGESLTFHTNDLLDSVIPYYKYYRDALLSGELRSPDFVSPILGGDEITVRLFHPGVSLISIVYTIFPTFAAYIALYFIRILLGIAGFVFLVYLMFDREQFKKSYNYAALVGFFYGILPYWPLAGGIMLYPLLLAVLVFAYKKNKIWVGLLTIPFIVLGVSLALYSVFVVMYLFVFLIIDLIRTKKLNIGLISCIVCVLIVSVILSKDMIFNVVSGSTIRTEQSAVKAGLIDPAEFFKSLWDILRKGHFHSGTNQQHFAAPFCFIFFVVFNLMMVCRGEKFKTIIAHSFNCCFLWFVLNGIIYTAYNSEPLRNLLYIPFPFLRGLNLSRTLWMNPLALYLCIFFALREFHEQFRVIPLVLAFWCFWAILNPNTPLYNVLYNDIGRNLQYAVYPEKQGRFLTWKQLYSEELFETALEDIGYDGEWSVAYGFLPGVLTYNGVRTLDGYDSGYSAEYKEQFTKLLQPYIDRGGKKTEYFFKSGIRAYVFCDELDYENFKDVPEAPIYIDMDVFKEMGGKYIFAVTAISNSEEMNLTLLGTYTHPASRYCLRVYRAD